MISGEKILITGVSGLVGREIAKSLTSDNEVWGTARFLTPEQRAGALGTYAVDRSDVEALGIRTVPADMAEGDFSALPQDFTYVLHLAHTRRGPSEFVEAVQANAVGAGKLLQHCRKAKAALVVSSTAVYSPPQDVFHRLTEDDAIGRTWAPWAPSSPVSKVSLEAVARFAAEAFDLPTTIVRLNTCYGPGGGMPVRNMALVAAGETIGTFADPYPHTPIHFDDMNDQLEALLDAGSVPSTTVNWCGDEVVTQRQWCELAGELSGKEVDLAVNPIPGTPNGNVSDNAKRMSITGPCKRPFGESFRAIYASRHGKR